MDDNELPKKTLRINPGVNEDVADENKAGLTGRGRRKETGL